MKINNLFKPNQRKIIEDKIKTVLNENYASAKIKYSWEIGNILEKNFDSIFRKEPDFKEFHKTFLNE